MSDSSFKFVIVGHVDHGKSTLIGRLLYDTHSISADKIEEVRKISGKLGREVEFAYFLDHLEEERKQEMTIDTTQVFFKTAKRNYVVIDAPGHAELIKNMITGASQAEAAILIVDVKEGIREQTKRHAYILNLLGIKKIIVALNKMDLVNFQEEYFNNIKGYIGRFIKSLKNIKTVCYVPISAREGENIAKKSKKMKWYRGPALLQSLDKLRSDKATDHKTLILPIQDVYNIKGKSIAVGRIEAGALERNQIIKIFPTQKIAKVYSIEKYPEQLKKAYSGDNIGIILERPLSLVRGNIICTPGKEPCLVNKFEASILWLRDNDFNEGEEMVIRISTQETCCMVTKIKKRINSATLEIIEANPSILKRLDVGEILIKTKKPIAISNFNDVPELGRFICLQDDNICAAGIISDY